MYTWGMVQTVTLSGNSKMKCCIFCDEQVFGNVASVFGEVMHLECEVQFFREYDAATGDITPLMDEDKDFVPAYDF